MPEQPKKRPWFQYHLSTAYIVMLLASVLLWLNVRWYERDDPTGYWTYVDERGWPFTYLHSTMGLHGITVFGGFFSPLFLALNIVVSLAIVSAVAIACEWHIRRAAKKKGKEF